MRYREMRSIILLFMWAVTALLSATYVPSVELANVSTLAELAEHNYDGTLTLLAYVSLLAYILSIKD